MKYSVIIPVYNCEKYIKKSIQSVLNKHKEMEIILIDDGSTDTSGEICDNFAKQYKYIFVYHTKNHGAGHARNIGIKKSSGDYIIFLDSDDMLSENFFDNISSLESNNYDVIFFETIKLFKSGITESMNEGLSPDNIIGKKKNDILENISKINKFPASCSGKIIKRRFLIENNINFLTNRLGEDIDLTLNILIKGNSFGYYNHGTYIYRQSDGSRSSKGNKKSVEDLIYIIEKWIYISENSIYKNYILSYLAYEYGMIFPFLGALDDQQINSYLIKMDELSYLLKYAKTKKIKAINICKNLLGIKKTSKLLNYYVNKRDNK